VADVDQRFSLANERTFLAWMRTSLALLVGGVAAAKAVDFDHEVLRWVVAGPPMAGGALAALEGARRWRSAERAMDEGRPLPAGPDLIVFRNTRA
jgi:putative membrane protein